jgi:hypothetical protein
MTQKTLQLVWQPMPLTGFFITIGAEQTLASACFWPEVDPEHSPIRRFRRNKGVGWFRPANEATASAAAHRALLL